MSVDVAGDIVEDFEHAVEYIKNAKLKISKEDRIQLHALFNQAVIGDNDTEKPGMLQVTERQKWAAWKELSGLTVEEAMAAYVELVTQIDPNYTPRRSLSKESIAVVSEFKQLPPVPPLRPMGELSREEMERQLSIASGTNPVNNTVDDMRRQNLYERLSRFYSIVDKGRLNKGIGDVIEYGLQKGEQEMSSRLSEKYGMSLNQFEEEENKRAEADRIRQETARRASIRRINDMRDRMNSLEKRLADYFFHVDPDRLEKGFKDLLAYTKVRGEDALNRKLYQKYGYSLNDNFKEIVNPPSRDASLDNQFESIKKQNEKVVENLELDLTKLHEITLPSWVKEGLISFYAKYDPERVKQGDIKLIYQWTERNGLKALDVRLKEKYNESLTEFNETSQRLRDELIAFYTKADKSKLVSGLDGILTWGIKNGRRALNLKLQEKYGYDLDSNGDDINDVEF